MIHICIPSRDEERTIGVLLWKIRDVMLDLGRDYQVFVLDDGSRDGTRKLLEKYKRVLPLTVLSEPRPIGYGRAVERLLRAAAGWTGYPKRDAIVTMQGDFTEHPEQLPALIKTFEGGADIVAGEPGAGSGDLPRSVRFARWLGRIALGRVADGAPGGDPLQGFRAYRAVVVKKAMRAAGDRPLITTDGWAANAELLKVLAPFARRVAEVPVSLRYDIRRRPTRVRVFPTVREILRVRKVAPLALLVLASLGLAPAPASAQQASGLPDSSTACASTATRLPFAPGEELKYKVKYGVFSVGEARMTVAGIDTVHNVPTYAVEWHIKGSVLGFGIDEKFSSWMDTETLVARRFVKDQGKRYREFEFFPEDRRVQRIDYDTTWAMPTSLPLDDVSFVYFTRTLPLEVEKTYTFNRFYKDEGNPVVLKVLRQDQREVAAGVFNTIVVQPIIQTDGLFSEGGEAEIHFSDDERRLVVYMKVAMPVVPGNLTMHLEEITEGVPMDAGTGNSLCDGRAAPH